MLLKRLQRWLNRNSAPAKRSRRTGKQSAKLSFRPQLEQLEDRTMPSAVFTPGAYTVPTNNTDDAWWVGSGSPKVEPLILVNPNNPANLILSSNGELAVSTNGGQTYSRPRLPFPDQANTQNNGDPAIVFNSQGRLFWANMGTPAGGAATVFVTEVDPLHGTPIGLTIAVNRPPSGASDDKPFLAADGNGNLFIAWTRFTTTTTTTVLLSRSTNGGITWSDDPVTVSPPNTGFYVWPATVSIAPSGDVFVAYHASRGTSQQVLVARYNNDLSNQISLKVAIAHARVRPNYPGTDFGTAGVGQSWVLTDPTRPGNVYVVAVNDPAFGQNGDPADVVFARSTDSGQTWTTSTAESGPNNSMQLFVTAAIDKFGDIAIAWYDNRAGQTIQSGPGKGNFLWDVYAKYNTDGGLDFTQDAAFKVSDTPLDPDTANPPDPKKGVRIDDYFGISLFGDKAYVAWEGNTFLVDAKGNFVLDAYGNRIVTGDQVMTDSFDIRGSLTYTDPFAVGQYGPGHGTYVNVTLSSLGLNPMYFQLLENGSVQYVGQWSNLTGITINAVFGNDVVNIENTGAGIALSGVPVTVNCGAGDDTVNVSSVAHNLNNIVGDLTLHGNAGLNRLFINDQASDQVFNPVPFEYDIGVYTVQRQNLHKIRQKSSLPTGLILYDGFTGGVVINGGNQGNRYQVSGSPSSLMTLNTGLGADTVNVLATTGPLMVNGQSGLDTVNIGSGGSVRSIGNTLTVTNPDSYSAVTVDDSADSAARTVIIYNNGILNGSYTVISGLTPGGDILLHGLDLRSLMILAGGGNTFRIHDTLQALYTDGNRILPTLTTINTGVGPDNVTIDGTTGALALDVQGAPQGANLITVGSPTVGLNGINGSIDITGATGVVNDLTIDDSGSTMSHEYIIDRKFVQRLGKAKIGYQNMSSLGLRTGTQKDHITVQNTMPVGAGKSTTIYQSGGDDQIDVTRTTGTLLIYASGHGVVNVGNATNSLDNIQGVIVVTPYGAGNAVTLNLDDQAATTPEQLDVAPNFFGTSFQRSGAATISVLFNPLALFQWTSGSGGTTFNEYARAAQTSNFILGNDTLNIGTRAGTISDFGSINVTGGVGFDAVNLIDSGETRSQTYNISLVLGRETIATRGTTVTIGSGVEAVTLAEGSGGNVVNTNAGFASATSIVGGAGLDRVTVNDQGTTTQEKYTLEAHQLTRTDPNGVPDMAPISFAAIEALTLNVGSGYSVVYVQSTAAGVATTVNGQPGALDVISFGFGPGPDTGNILGPVTFNGQAADGDFAYYSDYFNAKPQTYNVSTNPALPQNLLVTSTGAAPVSFNNLSQVVFSDPLVGGSSLNIKGVPAQTFLNVDVSNGDKVTLGSLAPNLGGTLTNIKERVAFTSYSPTDAVALVLDDSGNADLTPKNVTYTPTDNPADDARVEGFAPSTVYWKLGSNASVSLLGGVGGTNTLTFNDQGTTTLQGYALTANQLTRTDANSVADMTPISFSGFAATTLNVSSGGSLVNVVGSAAGSTVTVNGHAGSLDTFVVHASPNAILGQVIFNGQSADGDFAEYDDSANTAPHTYKLTSTTVGREDLAPMVFSGLSLVQLYTPLVGGSKINVNSGSPNSFLGLVVANGDQVTIGSMAPGLGGTLANILAHVVVASSRPNDAVTLILDDSGNIDTTAKHITFSTDADSNITLVGLAPAPLSWRLALGSSVTVRGGAADEIFSMQPFLAATPLTIVGGTGINTLDYSSYVNYPGLVSWYKAEGNANDAVGGNNGVTVGGVAYAPGKVGQAFSFNGVDSEVLVPHAPSLEPSTVTVEFWVNSFNPGNQVYLLSKGANGNSYGSYSLDTASGDGLFFDVFTTLGFFRSPAASLASVFDGQWHHVAGTFDGQAVRLFVDGVQQRAGTILPGAAAIAYGLATHNDLLIGNYDNGSPQVNPHNYHFNGLLDEVSVYNRALSAADVQAIYTAGSAGKSGVGVGVVVNLALGTATGLTGIANIQNVIGSPGNDTLIAGARRSILIGGGGADHLFGGSGEAILIAGTTDFTQPSLNVAALDAIFQEWNRTDLGFDDRMSDLLTGSNSQGVAAKNVIAGTAILLNGTSVHDDLAADVLTGGTGRDWYFIDASDVITNKKPGDAVTMV